MDCLTYSLIAREYAVSKLGTNQPYRKLREFKSSNKEQVQVQPMINKEETKPEPELKSQIKAPPKRTVRRTGGTGWFGK